eukprot:scaffold131242_cov57-Phaeocystis_antarctica.AAC.2
MPAGRGGRGPVGTGTGARGAHGLKRTGYRESGQCLSCFEPEERNACSTLRRANFKGKDTEIYAIEWTNLARHGTARRGASCDGAARGTAHGAAARCPMRQGQLVAGSGAGPHSDRLRAATSIATRWRTEGLPRLATCAASRLQQLTVRRTRRLTGGGQCRHPFAVVVRAASRQLLSWLFGLLRMRYVATLSALEEVPSLAGDGGVVLVGEGQQVVEDRVEVAPRG